MLPSISNSLRFSKVHYIGWNSLKAGKRLEEAKKTHQDAEQFSFFPRDMTSPRRYVVVSEKEKEAYNATNSDPEKVTLVEEWRGLYPEVTHTDFP